ncbi:MAG: DUF5320 domain-containing protein [Anaerolineaceae bacterium]|nr:DUF5320 domain-containing protein [Anaerolineaceae bacterium]MBN2677581.1 DUF5320 domain-containing protein [Anaerolineaceae bacterium]
MPGMDRTGPLGTGPIGRGMGPCGGGQAFGRGRGRGFGRGFGLGLGRLPAVLPVENEKEILEQQKSWLETQLEAVTRRLEESGETDKSK